MAIDELTPKWSTKDRALVRTVTELLEGSQYEDLAELLDRVRLACEQEGDTLPAHRLDLARRICLACGQSQAEADWHQQAREEAAQREGKLRQQLNTLLDLAGERDLSSGAPASVPGPTAPVMPEPVGSLSLRQRLQDMLRRRPGPQPLDSLVSEATANVPASPSLEKQGDPEWWVDEGAVRPVEPTAEETVVPTPLPVAEIEDQATRRTEEPEPPVVPPCEEVPLPSVEKGAPRIPPPIEEPETPTQSLPEKSCAVEPIPAEEGEEVPPPHMQVEGPATAATKEPEPSSPIHAVEPETPTTPPARQLTLPPSAGPDVLEAPIPSAIADEAKQVMPSLAVHCLGPFRVYQDDQPVVDWPSSRGKAVLKYLVTHRERPSPKEVLMELFWPGAHPDAARNNLNVAIYGLRQALRQARSDFSHVLFQDDCYLLNPELRIWIDVEEFRKHCRVAHDLEQSGELPAAMREYRAAEALHQGEFLEEDRYEDWPIPLRQSLQASFLSLLDCLSRYCLDQGDHIACTTVCRKMLTVDACNEEAHRRLMRCYSRQGQRYLALRQYHLCVEALKEELDVIPASATTELCERIRHHQQI